jgi:hypothetical protein
MIEKKNFFGKTGQLETDPENKKYYLIEFNSKNEVYNFYDDVRELCYEKNFDLDPANWAAYGYFNYEGENFYINSPTQSNGDSNWYKYEDESSRFCMIYLNNNLKIKEL